MNSTRFLAPLCFDINIQRTVIIPAVNKAARVPDKYSETINKAIIAINKNRFLNDESEFKI